MVKHRFVPLYLPPYNPELNLIEILWKHAKYPWRAFTSWTRETLAREVTELMGGFNWLLKYFPTTCNRKHSTSQNAMHACKFSRAFQGMRQP